MIEDTNMSAIVDLPVLKIMRAKVSIGLFKSDVILGQSEIVKCLCPFHVRVTLSGLVYVGPDDQTC